MKPSPFSIVAICVAVAVAACSPSPYYNGTRSGFAPGAVPRDGRGQPVLGDKQIEYALPQPSNAPAALANQIIYYEDLHYASRPKATASAALDQPAPQP